MVDMSKIKLFDTVTLRNGEVFVVAEVKFKNLWYPYSVRFDGELDFFSDYLEDGRWHRSKESPIDIVKHTPEEDVKND